MKDEQVIETVNAEGKRVRIIRRVVRRPNNLENKQIKDEVIEKDTEENKIDENSLTEGLNDESKNNSDYEEAKFEQKESEPEIKIKKINAEDYKISLNDDLNVQIMIKKIINVSSNFMAIIVGESIFMINESGAKLLGNLSVDDYSGRNIKDIIKNKDVIKDINKIIQENQEVEIVLVKDDNSEVKCIIKANYFKANDSNSYVIEAREVKVKK
ncbi:MAG: hypothetical protein BWY78_00399 [Alphaproteobacteria bacterium ADurb.Bin438]|nr:MAG: hypothetical protein BWY78_00399 [Alphaproteobacteria bacterium ADurb.Bin438]